MRLLSAAIALTLLSLPAQSAERCRLSAKDTDAVESLAREYRDGWFEKDPRSAVMRLFTEDAVILPHHGTAPRTGHSEIEGFWWPPGSGSFELIELTMNPAAVDGCGESAWVWGRQSVAWRTRGDPKVTSNAGTFLYVARKEQRTWRITRLMWDDPPNQTR